MAAYADGHPSRFRCEITLQLHWRVLSPDGTIEIAKNQPDNYISKPLRQFLAQMLFLPPSPRLGVLKCSATVFIGGDRESMEVGDHDVVSQNDFVRLIYS